VCEGYKDAICPECGSKLIAANRNSSERKRAKYFRHITKSNCSQETLIHLWAKQIIMDEQHVLLPSHELEASARIRRVEHIERKVIPENLVKLTKVEMELRVLKDGEYRIPDILAFDVKGSEIYIEIHVTNPVTPEKKLFIEKTNVDCIEISLLPITEELLACADKFKAYVTSGADRHWINCTRYKHEANQLEQLAYQQVLKKTKLKDEERKDRAKQKQDWRIKHEELLSLIRHYSEREAQNVAINNRKRAFFDSQGSHHKIFQVLITQFNKIPDIVNTELKGELAFKCYRTVWQWEIYKLVVGQNYRPFEPESIFHKISSTITLSPIAERLNKDTLYPVTTESYSRRPEGLEGIKTKEWELIPKPIPTVRRYLKYLASVGVLEVLSGDTFVLRQGQKPPLT